MNTSDFKAVNHTRQVDPDAVQNVMQHALQRYEKDLQNQRARREGDLANLEDKVKREQEKEKKEKEAVKSLKRKQAEALDV